MANYLTHETEFRGDEIIKNRSKKRVVFCGVGALGSKLGDLLACQGYDGLVYIDKDKVESHNFGTQLYGARDVGRKKAVQAAQNVFARLKIKVEARDTELRASNARKLLKGADLVVDLFDNVESRLLVRDFCGDNNIEAMHCGMSDDGFAEIEWNENYRAHPTPEGDDGPCEYPLAANLVNFTVVIAAEIINKFVDQKKKQSVHFTLNDLHIDLVSCREGIK